jgi:D-alanine-D-alanine ligase-like ATP-grasp enzyme/poly-gamma-glutamate capsule biosynthesis protein CapA/YwtB (metallophosphatase superfamily)
VVIKPTHGVQGRGVFTRIEDEVSLRACWNLLEKILKKHNQRGILVEERFFGSDFRFFVVDRQIKGVLERRPASLDGDGLSTINQLIAAKNDLRRVNPDLRNRLVQVDDVIADNLRARGLTIESILPAGTNLVLRDNANISTGGDSVDRTDEIPPKIKQLVLRAVAAVPDLHTCGVDVLAKDVFDEGRLGHDNIVFTELEGDAAMGMHHFPGFGKPRNVARAILLSLFRHLDDEGQGEYHHDFDANKPLCCEIVRGIAALRNSCHEPQKSRSVRKSNDSVRASNQPVSPLASQAIVSPLRQWRSDLFRLISASISSRSRRVGSRRSNGSFAVTLCGDVSLGDDYLRRMKYRAELYQRLCVNPSSFFEDVKPLIAGSDVLIANLESCLVTDKQSPFEGSKRYLGSDHPARTTSIFKQISVTGVNLANNHTMDFGAEGLLETIERLGRAGIPVFGAGENRRAASKPLIYRIEVAGVSKTIHVIGALESSRKYQEQYRFYAGASAPGVNRLSRQGLSKRIKKLRVAEPQALIIVCPHWHQNYKWASDGNLELSSTLLSAGADLVIGHGAHMLQQCYWSEAGTILMSLGNFVFNSPGRYANFSAPPFSLIARIELGVKRNRWSSSLNLYPIVTDNLQTGFHVKPVNEKMLSEVYSLLTIHAPNALDFRNSFEPAEDERGFHIKLTRPISLRFAS